MAIGDKKSVVMESDRAVNGGIATLDSKGNVPFEQLGNVVRPNLLDNWYFGNFIDQRGGYIVPPGTPYYEYGSNTQVGITTTYMPYTTGNDGIGHTVFIIEPETGYSRWVDASSLVRGYVGSGYTIDRWVINANGAVVLSNDGVSIARKVPGSSYGNMYERVCSEPLLGKTITMSAIVNDELYTATGKVPDTIQPSATEVLTGDISKGIWVQVYFSYNGSLEGSIVNMSDMKCLAKAAKLELGTEQTLAHQNADGNWVLNEIPDYNEELLKCCMSMADAADTYANNRKTPAAIGAAPKGLITYAPDTRLFRCKTNDEIDTQMTTAYNMLANDTAGHFIFSIDVNGLVLGGGHWFVTIYRSDAWYGFASAVSYDTNNKIRVRTRSRIKGSEPETGVWTGWVDDINSANFASYATPANIGAVNKAGDMITGPLYFDDWGENGTSKTLFTTHNNRSHIRHERDENNSIALTLSMEEEALLGINRNGVYNNSTILHTGNKPSGNYTGNGSTSRDPINIGGLGDAIFIRSSQGMAIVSSIGAITMTLDGTITGVPSSEAKFDGVLTLNCARLPLNTNGIYYFYQVL